MHAAAAVCVWISRSGVGKKFVSGLPSLIFLQKHIEPALGRKPYCIAGMDTAHTTPLQPYGVCRSGEELCTPALHLRV